MENELIYINDVGVGGCKYYNKNIKMDCLLYPLQPDACCNNPNCYFKQLARKTQLSIEQSKELIRLRQELKESTVKNKNLKQECEELKKELKNAYWLRDCEQKRNLKLEKTLKKEILKQYQYRKALEEIEEFCITYSDNHDVYETVYRYILNIINKAKGEE